MTRLLAMTTALSTTLAAGSLALADNAAQLSAVEALDSAQESAQHAGDAISETAEQASEATSDAYDGARNEAADLADRTGEAARAAAEGAQAAGERAVDTAGDAFDDAKEAAGEAYTEAEQWWDGRTATTDAEEGFEKVALQNIDAEKLEGARAYDMNDEWIGEVSEVMLTSDKTLDAVHVDVGGLVGIGEHRVSMGPERLIATENADSGDVRVHIYSTKEQLMEQPAVDG